MPEYYVYRITVAGTDIEEWYCYEEFHKVETVKNHWLSDLQEKPVGRRLAKTYSNNIEVEPLWERKNSEDEAKRVKRLKGLTGQLVTKADQVGDEARSS